MNYKRIGGLGLIKNISLQILWYYCTAVRQSFRQLYPPTPTSFIKLVGKNNLSCSYNRSLSDKKQISGSESFTRWLVHGGRGAAEVATDMSADMSKAVCGCVQGGPQM